MELPLLESVPNVSVGRDVEVVDEVVRATVAGAAAGGALDGSRAIVADVHRDSDHDRTVVTIVGRGEALAGAVEALARAAIERVDIHAGHGVHPRVGVVDVVPVVALEETADARAAAFDMAERIGTTIGALGVPVVRYGLEPSGTPIVDAASTGEVRRGGPGTVAERITTGELGRVAGPVAPHPTAGVTICGVRPVLVAFNVDLAVDDLELARSIASRIRATAHGEDSLDGVRALGLRLASRGIAQVSTNVERPRAVGPARVLETVARLAEEEGVGVSAAELVGLAPDVALGPLRYACTRLAVPLLAGADPSLDAAGARAG